MLTAMEKNAWFVYELVDPRSDTVFYIGKTNRPVSRLCGHRNNPAGSAYERIQEIAAAGAEVKMQLAARFSCEIECLRHERLLIAKTPGLVNKAMNDRPLPGAARPPAETLHIGPQAFDGVLAIRDAVRIWKGLSPNDRRVLVLAHAAGNRIVRTKGYPITWRVALGRGAFEECKGRNIEKLRRKGLLKFDSACELQLTALGKFVAQNGAVPAARHHNILRVA